MHPVLLEFGFIKIFTYGVFVASGFFVAIVLAGWQAKAEGLDQEKVLDLCFYILVAAILGARLLYVLVEYKYFVANPLEIFKFWKGGLVYYGGLILGALVSFVYMRKHDMPIWKVADVVAPSLAIGQAIGRWGCFFAGCCYGKQTDVSWAIMFSDAKSLAPINIPLHPTQIYLSLNALFILGILIWLRKRKTFDGQIFWAYGALYSIGRFIIEFFRGDDRGFAVEGVLSTSQFIGVFTLAVSLLMIFSLRQGKTSRPVKR